MKNIVLVAAPAAGKGTLSELLVEKYGYIHISTGDLLRNVSSSKTELGNKISNMLKTGELIPDEIIFKILEDRLQCSDISSGYILDGFPRNINQAYRYDKILDKLNKDLGIVVVLNTDYEILKKRITGRMLCSSCGTIYNTLTGVNTPKVENICDKCGESLYKRSDDNEEAFKIRYETYLEKTKPIIDYYKEKGNLFFINSDNKENMLKEIEVLLND